MSATPDDGDERDSIKRNTGFALAEKFSGAFFTAILTLFLVRALGPDEFGVYALALSVGALVLLPSNLGIAQAASRFVAERHHDRDEIAGIVADSLWLKLTFGGLMSIALFALAEPIASAYGTEELAWPLRITAIAVFGQSMMLLCDSLFEALGKVAIYLRVVITESAAEATISILLVILGGGAAGATWGRAAAYGIATVMGLLLLFRVIGRNALPWRVPRSGNARRILGYGSALLVIDGVFTVFGRIPSLLIGAIISVPAVAFYEAPARLMAFLGYAGSAAATGVSPRMARGSEGPDNTAFERALRYLVVVQGIVVAPLVVWAQPLTELVLGSEYGDSVDVLRGLAVFAFLQGMTPLLARTVNYLGEAQLRIPIVIAALLIDVALNAILLPSMGVAGAGIATSISYTLYTIAHLWLCRRLVGTKMRRLAVSLVRTAIAVAAMALVLFAFGTEDVSLPLLFAGGLAGVVVYAGVLVAVREIHLETLLWVRRVVWANASAALAGRARWRGAPE